MRRPPSIAKESPAFHLSAPYDIARSLRITQTTPDAEVRVWDVDRVLRNTQFHPALIQQGDKRPTFNTEQEMNKLLKLVAAVSLLAFGTTTVMAQTQSEPPKAPTSSGAVKDEKPTDPNAPRNQSEIEKLKKEEKAGSKSTGG